MHPLLIGRYYMDLDIFKSSDIYYIIRRSFQDVQSKFLKFVAKNLNLKQQKSKQKIYGTLFSTKTSTYV